MASKMTKKIESDLTSPRESNQYLLPTLEGFRNKLLDLTTRNNLLNLGLKSQRTARLLRFVDCNLQAVLAGLTSGRQYSLSPLPEPPKEKKPLAFSHTPTRCAVQPESRVWVKMPPKGQNNPYRETIRPSNI